MRKMEINGVLKTERTIVGIAKGSANTKETGAGQAPNREITTRFVGATKTRDSHAPSPMVNGRLYRSNTIIAASIVRKKALNLSESTCFLLTGEVVSPKRTLSPRAVPATVVRKL